LGRSIEMKYIIVKDTTSLLRCRRHRSDTINHAQSRIQAVSDSIRGEQAHKQSLKLR